MKELIVSPQDAGQRCDKYVMKFLNKAPKSFVYKMLRKKNIVLNDKKSTGCEILNALDSVKLYLADETIEKFSQVISYKNDEKIFLNVVKETEDVIFVNKPDNLLSQKSKPNDISINEQIISYLLQKNSITNESLQTFRPSICNRLDRNTTGLITAGKTLRGSQELSYAFRQRNMDKHYIAVVKGVVSKSQQIEGFLFKDLKTNKVVISKDEMPGSGYIETGYRPIWSSDDCSLLEVHLITGRTHQIRAHLASIGHPIIGDLKYGNKKTNEKFRNQYNVTSQLLHSYSLSFPQNSISIKELVGETFVAPLPNVFFAILNDKGGAYEHLEFERS